MPTMRQHDGAFEDWRRLAVLKRLSLAWKGVRGLLGGLWAHGVGGRVLAILLAPIGLCYAVGTVLRDSFTYRAGAPQRRPVEQRSYLRHRYGGTQRVVNWREQRIVAALLRKVGPSARVMDVPSGHGRFTRLLAACATAGVVCVDIDV